MQLIETIRQLLTQKNHVIIAIDGRCGSGKTTLAVSLAKQFDCTVAVLKAKSPSCGKGRVYDGSFSGTLVQGDGVTAELLKKHGIAVYNEENYMEMFA